jgi:nucleoside-diphosphate-sugar epimerase
MRFFQIRASYSRRVKRAARGKCGESGYIKRAGFRWSSVFWRIGAMKILLIGGTGFIGPHVVRRLVAGGHDVAVFHRGQTNHDLPPEVVHVQGDRHQLDRARQALKRQQPELVVDMRPMVEDEASEVMQFFDGWARRLVALSSGDVYRAYGVLLCLEEGPLESVPISEDAKLRHTLFPYRGESPRPPDDPMRWADDYEKILVERAVMGTPGLPGTVLRLPMVYGPRDDFHRLFPYLKRIDDGRSTIVLDEAFAGWRWTRGYVANVAEAIALAVEDDRAAGQILNVGEPEAFTEAEWVAAIGRAAGWRGSVVAAPGGLVPPPRGKARNYAQPLVTNTTRIRDQLGYHETVSFDDGLRRTIAWERANPPSTIDPGQFDYAAEDAALGRLGAGKSGERACAC